MKPGLSVRDALSKAMKLRKLDPSMCAVYRCSQSEVKLVNNLSSLKSEANLLICGSILLMCAVDPTSLNHGSG